MLEEMVTPKAKRRRDRKKLKPQYSTPDIMKRSHKREPPSIWPYYFLGVCFFIMVLAIMLYPIPAYRENIRFDLFRAFGAAVVEGEWKGGHREMAPVVYLGIALGLSTLMGAVMFTYANVSPPIPTGKALSISRFLKRKPAPQFLNMTFGEMCFVTFVIYLNVFWFVSFTAKNFQDLADIGITDSNVKLEQVGEAFGLNIVLCMVFLGLPATRNCFWMVSLGIDYAHGIKYHRWLGYATFAALLGHCMPYYISWTSQGTFMANAFPKGATADEQRAGWENLFGQIAFLSILIMVLTSINHIRRNYYNVFYYAHHLYIVVIPMACMHYSKFVLWLYPTICLYLIHRILAFSQSRRACEVVDFKPLAGGVVRLCFRRSFKIGGQFETGQFCYLRVPSISIAQWHAFSISSYPEESSDKFTVHVKGLGDWTHSLYGLAIKAEQEKRVPLIYVDGFYGKATNKFERYPILVFFAGGIGATPILSILGHMLHVIKDGINPGNCQEVRFYWTSREISIFKEFEPLLNRVKAYDPHEEVFRIRLSFTGQQDIAAEENHALPAGTEVPEIPDTSHVPRYAFHQCSRSPVRRVVVFLITFFASFLLLCIVRYDYKLLGSPRDINQRPLQRFMEFLVVVLGAAIGFAVALSERRPAAACRAKSGKCDDLALGSRSNNRMSMNSLGGNEEGISHPVITSRLDVQDILTRIAKEQRNNEDVENKGIGVWVSGPTGLIHDVEVKASTFGGLYDVHYEEFEL